MSSSSVLSESIADLAEIAKSKCDNIRQTLENLHSQSDYLMRIFVHWKDLENHFASIQKTLDDDDAELDAKKQQLEWKSKFLKQRSSAITAMSAEVQSREADLVLERMRLDERCLEIDQTFRLVSMCLERAEEREGVSERNIRALQDREEELDLRDEKLTLMERGLLENYQEFERKKKMLEERETKLGKRESKFRERCAVFSDKERCMDVMISRLSGGEVEIDNADIRFYVTMSGMDLVGFVCGRGNGVEAMRDEVKRGMRLSLNPAKLVLDGLQGFYGGDLEEVYELRLIRRCCIVLLEQLVELKPEIKIPERQKARLLAVGWKERMKSDCFQKLEVMGFLKLVDAYRLTDGFDKNELAMCIESAAHLEHAPALCRRLGLEDKARDIVRHLILDKHAVDAIMRTYVTDMKISALVSIIKCIKEFKLDSKYPTDSLEEQLLELQRQTQWYPLKTTLEEELLVQLQNSSSTADWISLPSSETKSPPASIADAEYSDIVGLDISDSEDIEDSPKLHQNPTSSSTFLSSPCFLASQPVTPPSASFTNSNLSPIRHSYL